MKRTPLRRVSKRQAAKNRIYSLLRKDFLQAHETCQWPGCEKLATDIHHMAGRYSSTLDISTFMAVCRSHHDRIHSYPNQAREKGYLSPVAVAFMA
jgi:hypothetical protein